MTVAVETEPQEGAVADRLTPQTPPPSPSASSLAVAAAPPTSTARELESRMTGTWMDAMRGEREARMAKSAAVGPAVDEAGLLLRAREDALAKNPPPMVPVLPPPPKRGVRAFLSAGENEAPEQSIAKLVQSLGLFAAGLSGAMRKDATGALSAFSGAMKGWYEGDKERADRDYETWKAGTRTLLDNYGLQREAYNDWVALTGVSVDSRLKGLQIQALKYDDRIAAEAAAKNDIGTLLDTLSKRNDHADKIAMEFEKIVAQRERTRALDERAERFHAEQIAEARAARGETRADRLDRQDERRDEKQGKEAKGEFYDTQQGRIRQITEGELRADLASASGGTAPRFKHLNNTEKAAIDRLVIAPPLLARLDQLIEKINAAAPGENITRGLLNKLRKRAGIDKDIATFENLNADMAVELASALSGGSPRISILAMIRGDAQANLTMTQDVAKAQVQTSRTTINNRLTALTGDPKASELLAKDLAAYETNDKPNLVYDERTGTLK